MNTLDASCMNEEGNSSNRAAYSLLLDDQLALGHGSRVKDIIDKRGQMVGGVLDGLDVVRALFTKSPGSRPQHSLRQPFRHTRLRCGGGGGGCWGGGGCGIRAAVHCALRDHDLGHCMAKRQLFRHAGGGGDEGNVPRHQGRCIMCTEKS